MNIADMARRDAQRFNSNTETGFAQEVTFTAAPNSPPVTATVGCTTTRHSLAVSQQGAPYKIAGKTGTAQGAFNLPWNDSSAFAAFSKSKAQPYTAVAYVEKAGFGSRAAAPIVKCIFLVLAGRNIATRAVPSDPLDPTGFAVAEPQRLRRPGCLGGAGSSVRD
jgi:penicillin-binding protein 2